MKYNCIWKKNETVKSEKEQCWKLQITYNYLTICSCSTLFSLSLLQRLRQFTLFSFYALPLIFPIFSCALLVEVQFSSYIPLLSSETRLLSIYILLQLMLFGDLQFLQQQHSLFFHRFFNRFLFLLRRHFMLDCNFMLFLSFPRILKIE